MSQIEVKIIAGSVSDSGVKITTFELTYPRFMHSEFMTHRVISKNAASSRAIPTKKLIDIVKTNPVIPVSVGKNQPGMQADEEVNEETYKLFIQKWKELGFKVATEVESMLELGVHKQTINRMLEPWLPIKVVATATDWDNFFELRDSVFAQPEFRLLAKKMKTAMNTYKYKKLEQEEWHLPYITEEDKDYIYKELNSSDLTYQETVCLISVARCARVSYALGDLNSKTLIEEFKKGKELSRLKHMSPFEHQAKQWESRNYLTEISKTLSLQKHAEQLADWLSRPNTTAPYWMDYRNFRGWRSFRSYVEHGMK